MSTHNLVPYEKDSGNSCGNLEMHFHGHISYAILRGLWHSEGTFFRGKKSTR